MKYLTIDEHREVVRRMTELIRTRNEFPTHTAGIEYTSLMTCLLLHNMSAADSLITLHKHYGNDWFPVTTGYLVTRSMLEADVTAHYLSADPTNRSRRYIDFEYVIRKNALEAIEQHRVSDDPSWREGLQLMYNHEYAPCKAEIDANYNSVRSMFETAKGKRAMSWSGKSIRQMAEEVKHLESYDIFYTHLSAFTHVNIELANRFLRFGETGPTWSARANEFDVGNVFRYAATFLTCFLQLFGKEFGAWDDSRVMTCWDIHGTDSHER